MKKRKGLKIFFVHVLYLDTKSNPVEIVRHRIWGFYEDFKTAEKCIKENWTDIYENGYYNYALINEIGPGVCVSPSKQTWYRSDFQRKDFSHKVTKINIDPLNVKSKFGRRLIVW